MIDLYCDCCGGSLSTRESENDEYQCEYCGTTVEKQQILVHKVDKLEEKLEQLENDMKYLRVLHTPLG